MDDVIEHEGKKDSSHEGGVAVLERPKAVTASHPSSLVEKPTEESREEEIQDVRQELEKEENAHQRSHSLAPFKDEVFDEELGRGTLNSVHPVLEGKAVLKAPLKDFYPSPKSRFKRMREFHVPMKLADKAVKKLFNNPDRMTMYFDDPEQVKKVYSEEKELMTKYFDYVDDEHSIRPEILSELRDPESAFYAEIKKALKTDDRVKIAADTFEQHMKDKFMVGESLVIGHPQYLSVEEIQKLKAAGKKPPVSGYVVQNRVTGNVRDLQHITDKDMQENPELTEKLLTVALLQRKLYSAMGFLADSRPDKIESHPLDWYQATGNVMVADGHPIWTDSHWIWDGNTRIIGRKGKRGPKLIDFLGRRSVDRALGRYVSHLSSAQKEAA